MTDTRHRTTLEIRAEARDVKELEGLMQRTFDPRILEAFERAMERTAKLAERLAAAEGEIAKFSERISRTGGGPDPRPGASRPGGAGMPGPGAPGAGGAGSGPGRSQFWPVAAGAAAGSWAGHQMASIPGRISGMGGAVGRGEGLFQSLFSGIPIVGGLFGGALGRAQGLYGQHAAQEQSIAESFGATGLGGGLGGFAGQAAGLGLGRGAAAGQLARLAGETGLTGHALTEGGLAGTALRHQRTLGVDTAGILGAAGTAGGRFTAGEGQEMLEGAITAGFQAGFRETKLSDFVQTVASMVTQLRTEGVQVSPESIQRLITGVSGLGGAFRGEAGARAAQGMQGRARTMLNQPGMSGMMALRAAQRMNPDASFMDAMQMMEERPEEMVPALLSEVRKLGGTGDSAAMLMREMFPDLSVRQLRQAAAGEGEGSMDADELAREQQFRDERAQTGRQAMGRAARLAGRENRLAAIGGEVAGAVESIQDIEDNITKRLVPMMANIGSSLAKGIESLAGPLLEGDIGGMLSKIAGMIMGGVPGIGDIAGTQTTEQRTDTELASGTKSKMVQEITGMQQPTAADLHRMKQWQEARPEAFATLAGQLEEADHPIAEAVQRVASGESLSDILRAVAQTARIQADYSDTAADIAERQAAAQGVQAGR